jgi:hypothetical protein
VSTAAPFRLLLRAVRSSGPPYRAAREGLLAGGPEARQLVQRAAETGKAGRLRLTAEMILGWMDRPELCLQVRRLMRGEPELMPRGLPPSGTWGADTRGALIAVLGPQAVPRILELLTRSEGYASDVEVGALCDALALLADSRAEEPLRNALRSDRNREKRIRAAYILGEMGSTASLDLIAAVVRSPAEDPPLRRSALLSLLTLAGRDAFEVLHEVAAGRDNDLDLRATAIYALGGLSDPRAAEALQALSAGESGGPLARAISDALLASRRA